VGGRGRREGSRARARRPGSGEARRRRPGAPASKGRGCVGKASFRAAAWVCNAPLALLCAQRSGGGSQGVSCVGGGPRSKFVVNTPNSPACCCKNRVGVNELCVCVCVCACACVCVCVAGGCDVRKCNCMRARVWCARPQHTATTRAQPSRSSEVGVYKCLNLPAQGAKRPLCNKASWPVRIIGCSAVCLVWHGRGCRAVLSQVVASCCQSTHVSCCRHARTTRGFPGCGCAPTNARAARAGRQAKRKPARNGGACQANKQRMFGRLRVSSRGAGGSGMRRAGRPERPRAGTRLEARSKSELGGLARGKWGKGFGSAINSKTQAPIGVRALGVARAPAPRWVRVQGGA
jgi:hypothetical protein